MTDQIFVGVDVAMDWLDIHNARQGAAWLDQSSRNLGSIRRILTDTRAEASD